jgi:hypothetical protein
MMAANNWKPDAKSGKADRPEGGAPEGPKNPKGDTQRKGSIPSYGDRPEDLPQVEAGR